MTSVYSLGEIAQRFNLSLRGDADVSIDSVCTLKPGKQGSISFLAASSYRKQLSETQASAVILAESDLGDWGGNALLSGNPQADYARIAGLFDPTAEAVSPGVHPTAVIADTAIVDPTASIAAGVVIGAATHIEADCRIGPGCVIGAGVRLGEGGRLVANVTLCDGVSIGKRAHFQPGVVIGGRGFGLAPEKGAWLEIPQLGSVRIGDDVEIGANSCVDRGAIDDTVIEDGVKIDNLVQIGHNTQVGAHTAIAGCVGVAGSCRIGAHCQIGGAAGILGHLTIADGVVITAKSLVSASVTEAGIYSSSIPVQPASVWRRQLARLRKLDDLAQRLKALEKKS